MSPDKAMLQMSQVACVMQTIARALSHAKKNVEIRASVTPAALMRIEMNPPNMVCKMP